MTLFRRGTFLGLFAITATASAQVKPLRTPRDSRTVCRADKRARTITFYVRDGFGDGTGGFGNALAVPGAEKDAAVRTFTKAIGIFTGETRSVMDVENWVRMRLYSTPLESSDAKVEHS